MQTEAERKRYRRIAVIKLRQLGDVLLATPVLAALKEHFPWAEIDAIVNPGTGQMLEGHPQVNRVLEIDSGKEARGWVWGWKKQGDFVRRVRGRHYDLVVDLTTSDRSAFLTRLTGAPMRLGYRSAKGFLGRALCYTERVQPVRHEHIVLKHLRILQPLGIENPESSLVFPVSDADRAAAERVLPGGRPYFQVHPISRIPKKNWPAKFMAETVQRIARRGWLPVLTGSSDPAEKRSIQELCAALSVDFLDLSGQLTVKQLGAVSESAQCFLGVDTAPMHIAAAVGTPVIALFGPSNEKVWGPWCERKLVLSRDMPCRLPCQDKRSCPHIACLREFTPSMVAEQLDSFLSALEPPRVPAGV